MGPFLGHLATAVSHGDTVWRAGGQPGPRGVVSPITDRTPCFPSGLVFQTFLSCPVAWTLLGEKGVGSELKTLVSQDHPEVPWGWW